MATKEKKAETETYAAMEKRMQEILKDLNDEKLSLDEQIKLGEEGQALLDRMEKKLDELRAKVSNLSKASEAKPE